MIPAARCQSAAEILDRIAAGMPAEQALTNWARGARFAGSKDRAAVRDLVFDVLRRWRSTAAMGGADTGRARILGLLRQTGADPEALFTSARHAPAALTEAERQAGRDPAGAEALDLPDWLLEPLRAGLGPAAEEVAEALRHRAPITLRVNLLKGDAAVAQAALAAAGIATRPNPLSATALTVTGPGRGLAASAPYRDGLVELQDAASQAVVDLLPLRQGDRVLDYCAGGGGKALALAARLGGGPVQAHDADPRRMRDLPDRAARAGARIETVARPAGRFDLVLADAPCSGSGAWRRAPEGKWRLTAERLAELTAVQRGILERAAGLVAPGGHLAYATCSVLAAENEDAVSAFLAARPGWRLAERRQFLPDAEGDGFFAAVLAAPQS
ncbi:RsmB/NOP family class I SAM-dependent RNA methyltransferase [Roseivivax sp. CAU 1761]